MGHGFLGSQVTVFLLASIGFHRLLESSNLWKPKCSITDDH